MRRVYFAVLPVLSLILGIPSSPSRITASESSPAPAGNVIFEDDFNRDESTPDKEEIGNGWTTNSAWRANGKKQVDLDDGAMHVTRLPEADHGVAIFQKVKFQDAIVQLRFKLGKGDLARAQFASKILIKPVFSFAGLGRRFRRRRRSSRCSGLRVCRTAHRRIFEPLDQVTHAP